MATVIKMPKMSDTMEEGLLVKWLKHSGDSVVPGDVLAEVETDKAVMELENYERGTLLHLAVKEGDRIAVDSVIAIVGSVGEDYESLLEGVVEEEKVPEKAESSSPRAVEEKKGTSEEKKETAEEKKDVPAESSWRFLRRRMVVRRHLLWRSVWRRRRGMICLGFRVQGMAVVW